MHVADTNQSDTDTKVIDKVSKQVSLQMTNNKMPKHYDRKQSVQNKGIPDYIWQQRLSCKDHNACAGWH